MTNYLLSKNKLQYHQQQGFTLLEVLVAITLTALVLGNLFALQSQSKHLAFKAQINLQKVINQRAYLNATWISNKALDSYVDELSHNNIFSVNGRSDVKKPAEQSQNLKFSLEEFTIVNQDNDVLLRTIRVNYPSAKD